MLRMTPEDLTKPIDFRTGNNGWGHALHPSTFCAAPARDKKEAKQDQKKGRRRYSFLCHSRDTPVMGREVLWSAEKGEKRGKIYDYQSQPGVDDMWEFWVVVEG